MNEIGVIEGNGSAARANSRRDLLLGVAATLFRKRGFNGVGIDDIGGALGLTGPAIFHYVPSKSALLVDIIDRQLSAFEAALPATADDSFSQEAIGRTVAVGLASPNSLAVCLRNLQYLDTDTRASLEFRMCLIASALTQNGIENNRAHLRTRAAAGVLISLALADHPSRLDRQSLAIDITMRLLSIPLPNRSAIQTRVLRKDLQHRAARAFRSEAILTAAARLFKERGFNGVSLREIGAAAGITASAVNRRFVSKEQLLAALFARLGGHIGSAFYDALARAADAGEALKEAIKAYASGAVKNRDLICLNLSETYRLPPNDFQERRKRQRIYTKELTHLLMQTHSEMSEAEANARSRAALVVVSEIVNDNRLAAREGLVEDLTTMALSIMSSTSFLRTA